MDGIRSEARISRRRTISNPTAQDYLNTSQAALGASETARRRGDRALELLHVRVAVAQMGKGLGKMTGEALVN